MLITLGEQLMRDEESYEAKFSPFMLYNTKAILAINSIASLSFSEHRILLTTVFHPKTSTSKKANSDETNHATLVASKNFNVQECLMLQKQL